MLLARRYKNDFLLLLLWWFPLGNTEQRKSTLAVAGRSKSLLGQRTQVVKQLPSSGSVQYNPNVNSMHLLLCCCSAWCLMQQPLLLRDNTRENKEHPPPLHTELIIEFGNFLPSTNTNIFLNSGKFVEIHKELVSLVKLYILTLNIFLNPGLSIYK